MTVYTDHSAVKAVLETPIPSAKHARWWTQVYASGVRNVKIVYRCGKENIIADTHSRNPSSSDSTPPPDDDIQAQVAIVEGTPLIDNMDISILLNVDKASDSNPHACTFAGTDLSQAQKDDPALQQILQFLLHDQLPDDKTQARKIVAQAQDFAAIDNILYFVDSKHNHRRRCAVPKSLRTQLLEENHSGPMAGHCSGEKLYRALVRHWW